MSCTRCNHGETLHNRTGRKNCTAWVSTGGPGTFDGYSCRCSGFTTAVLPKEGERLEFGRHRMDAPDAEAAETWPSLKVVERRRFTKVKRAVEKEQARQ
jgi:hypothetical protein